MSDRTKLGLGVLEAALLLGLLGDALLRATPWGLNVFLWTAAFAAGAHALSRQRGARAVAGEARWLWPVVLVLAAFFAWRDSITLKLLDTLAICGALSLIALGARGGRVKLAGLLDYVLAACVAAANAVFGIFPLVFADVKWKEIPRTGWSKHVISVARGLLIAVPLLLVFGALFVAADAIYEGFIEDTLAFEADVAFTHVLLFALFTWVTGGFLRGMLLAEKPITNFSNLASRATFDFEPSPYTTKVTPDKSTSAGATTKESVTDDEKAATGKNDAGVSEHRATESEPPQASARGGYRFSAGDDENAQSHEEFKRAVAATEEKTDEKQRGAAAESAGDSALSTPSKVSLGIIEVGVVLGLLDLLFFSFVAVQLRYFFGDAQHVITSAGLTFSDYARRGFFELVWVALLALPLMLAAHWLLRKTNPLHEKIFRALAGAMTAMLFVIMASGIWRMRLYQSAYGQTELRFYTTAFMVWLGVVLIWFVLTVLRGRRASFAFGAVVSWLVILCALHFVNPSDHIARTNIAQARESNRFERFDAAYAASLGPDAAPALIESLPEMRQRERFIVASNLVRWLDNDRQTDWRSWNYSRRRARALIGENEATLRDWHTRWQNELQVTKATAPPTKTEGAMPKIESATAAVRGTPFSIRVERRTLENSSAGFGRAAMLLVGDTVVSNLPLLANDDGVRTRIEVLKISDTTILLQDAYGVYVVDLEQRRILRQEGAGVGTSSKNLIGAFDLDASRTWQFTPTATPAKAQGAVQRDSR